MTSIVRGRPRSATPSARNQGHIETELETIQSTPFLTRGALSRRQSPYVQVYEGSFEVFPPRLEFGLVPHNREKTLHLRLRNLGTKTDRIRVTPPPDERIRFAYAVGTTKVAAGMTIVVTVSICGTALGMIDSKLSINAGSHIYDIPVKAKIVDQGEFEEKHKDHIEGNDVFDTKLLETVPRMPNTHFNYHAGTLHFERSFQYTFDPSLSVEEIRREDEARTLRLLDQPLPPMCVRVYHQVRLDDSNESMKEDEDEQAIQWNNSLSSFTISTSHDSYASENFDDFIETSCLSNLNSIQ